MVRSKSASKSYEKEKKNYLERMYFISTYTHIVKTLIVDDEKETTLTMTGDYDDR